MDFAYEAEEVRVLGRCIEAGLLYRGKKPVLWCPSCATALAEAYVFLRQVEHRIQFLDDQQTHLLPTDDHDLAWIAAAAHYDRLLAAGVRVYENRRGEHSKIVLIDGEWVAFGSYNFEHAAHDRLAEAMLVSRDPRATQPAADIFAELRQHPDNLLVTQQALDSLPGWLQGRRRLLGPFKRWM